jgi:hypothetical protein
VSGCALIAYGSFSIADPLTLTYEAPLSYSFSSGCSPSVICGTQDTFFPTLPNSFTSILTEINLSVTGSASHTVSAVGDMPNDKSLVSASVANPTIPYVSASDSTSFSLGAGQTTTITQQLSGESVGGIYASVRNGYINDANVDYGFVPLSWDAGFGLGTPYERPDHSGNINAIASLKYSFDTLQNGDLTQQEIDDLRSRETYTFDAVYDSDESNFSWLRGLFVFTSGLIGRDEPDDVVNLDTNYGSLGIRGSAEQIVRNELLNNPNSTLYGNAGIWLETASPMSVSTIVDTSEDAFNFSFDFSFLDPNTTLTVTLGETDILTLFSGDFELGARESISMSLDWEALSTELVFTLDGDTTGLDALIYNVWFPGADVASITDWFVEGNGTAELVYVTSDVQLDALAEVAAVPTPIAFWLFSSGLLGLVGLARRKKAA